MCEQCKPDDLLIPQLPCDPATCNNGKCRAIGKCIDVRQVPQLPRGLAFWNESRSQRALENAK